MSENSARDRITRIASALIDAKGTADTDWLTHLARVAGATFHELDVPVGAVVAARDGTVVTHDGLHPLLGYATAGLHTVIWHVGRPAFSSCRNCGVGSGIMLTGRAAGERGEWELRCEGCLLRTVRAAALPELSGGARAGGENGAQGGTAAAGLAEIATRLNAAASGLRAAERLLHRRMGPHWHETDEWQGLDALRAEARQLALASELLADEVRAAGADATSDASAAGRRA